jgi:CheY-like chemotaxis protein
LENDPELTRLLRLALQMAFYEKAKHWAKQTHPLLEGLDVYVCATGEQAAAALQHAGGHWDSWFVDVSIPREAALAFLATCRGTMNMHCGRMVALAERGDEDGATLARAAGAEAVLYKPFTPADVWAYMEIPECGPSPKPAPKYIQPGGML